MSLQGGIKMNNQIDKLCLGLEQACNDINKIFIQHETSCRATKERFNLFTILLKEHDETRLHSRFIANLLNPYAKHDCGDLFLNFFLLILSNGIYQHNSTELSVDKYHFKNLMSQKCITVQTEYKNIDIYIEFENFVIGIENKIYAYEQQDQLSRYIEILSETKKDFCMLYLTLDGKDSYTHKEKKYYKISYNDHILKWLELCLKNTYKYININQSLQQYKRVISKLTGNNFEGIDMEKIKELLLNKPEIVKYSVHLDTIKLAIKEIISKCKDDFFTLINNSLTEDFKFDLEYSWEVQNRYFSRKNKIKLQGKYPVYIEFDNVENKLYMGISYWDSINTPINISNVNTEKIKKLVKDKFGNDIYYAHPHWFAGLYKLSDNILSPEYISTNLQNDDKLKNDAKKIAEKIKNYLDFVIYLKRFNSRKIG